MFLIGTKRFGGYPAPEPLCFRLAHNYFFWTIKETFKTLYQYEDNFDYTHTRRTWCLPP